ncbi:MAG: hypothetical protein J7K72_01490 [Candidatus Aenigmarchaeota archaeon]|nr:hypothetical protein [Candidatus Aenigmarchaeota archaeon]
MRLSLELLVIASVILIVATVVILIFGRGIQQGSSMLNARSNCINIGSSSCRSIGVLPPTWSTPMVTVDGKPMSCQELTGREDCKDFGVEPSCEKAGGVCKKACESGEEEIAGQCGSGQKCCKKSK